jgi:quercetin dioxygenase-like cupin family protein
MHRTVSLDYGIVIEGEIELILDSGERKKMVAGDIAVQRGTMHAWRNMSDAKWARMLYILQPSKPLTIGAEKLGEDLETMEGVRAST